MRNFVRTFAFSKTLIIKHKEMKKNLLYAVAALSVAACTTAPNTDYTVEFNTKAENEGKMVYVMDYDDDEVKLDSAIVEMGKAVFVGKIEEPRMARLLISGKRGPMFILEAGNITIDSLGTASGSVLNDAFEAFSTAADSLQQEFMKIAKDTTAKAQQEAIVKAYGELDSATCADNQGNPIGYFLFIQKAYEFEPAELDSVIAADSTLLKYKRVQKLVDAAKCKKATSPGNKFTDFEITHEGATKKLSDYAGKGNYTIVDFWASWCGPCIKETATLKEIYKKWNGKGLDIVGVAVWDEPQNTVEAIEKHKLPWNHIINGQNIPTDLYGISGIPCIVIINPEGEIVGRDVRGEDLKKFIDEKLKDFKK